MEDLLRRFESLPKIGPYQADPDFRHRRVEQCAALLRQSPEVQRVVHEVSQGAVTQALSYEASRGGCLLYLWEHTPPQGYTLRVLQLPTTGERVAPSPPPSRRRWLLRYLLLMAAGATLALGVPHLQEAQPGVPASIHEPNEMADLVVKIRIAVREEIALLKPPAVVSSPSGIPVESLKPDALLFFDMGGGQKGMIVVLPKIKGFDAKEKSHEYE